MIEKFLKENVEKLESEMKRLEESSSTAGKNLDDIKVVIYGIMHPKVIKNFGIKNPVTLCEIDLQLIMDLILEGKLLEGFV